MRICIIPEYPVSLMTGGLQVQAEETHRALTELGGEITAELFNWSDRRPLADLYHFIGFPPYLNRITELIHEAGRPYLLTILFGGAGDPMQVWLARMRRLVKSRLQRHERYDAILKAAAIITVTEADARVAGAIYGLDAGSVHVV